MKTNERNPDIYQGPSFSVSFDYYYMRFSAVITRGFDVGYYSYQVEYLSENDPSISGTVHIYRQNPAVDGIQEWREKPGGKSAIHLNPLFIQELGKRIEQHDM